MQQAQHLRGVHRIRAVIDGQRDRPGIVVDVVKRPVQRVRRPVMGSQVTAGSRGAPGHQIPLRD